MKRILSSLVITSSILFACPGMSGSCGCGMKKEVSGCMHSKDSSSKTGCNHGEKENKSNGCNHANKLEKSSCDHGQKVKKRNFLNSEDTNGYGVYRHYRPLNDKPEVYREYNPENPPCVYY